MDELENNGECEQSRPGSRDLRQCAQVCRFGTIAAIPFAQH
jgi:hypothetical protein